MSDDAIRDDASPRLRMLPEVLTARTGAAAGIAMSQWAQSTDGIGDRFRASAFARYGWAPRAALYQKRQRRVFGTTLPFTSPARKSYGAIGKFRDVVKVAGLGHQIQNQVSKTRWRVLSTFAAARGLNLRGYQHEWARYTVEDDRRIQALINPAMAKAIDAGIEEVQS